MKLSINGELKTIKTGENSIPLANLIESLGYNPRLVVVELNKTIINSEKWGHELIKSGDSLEIVTIVGGGY